MKASERLQATLDFKNQILRQSEWQVGDRRLRPEEIIKILEPHLTPERVARVRTVVSGRTFQVATVVEHLYDIGNISAVMRSAESFGFLPFHLIEKKDAKYKKSDRISKGSEKWLDLKKWSDTRECLGALKKAGYRICVTTLEGARPITEESFDVPTAIVFGNEKDGVSQEALEMADSRVMIPMTGFTQSFNISVAAALSFYQIYQKRVAIKGKNGDLTPEEVAQVTANYYLRTLETAGQIIEHYFSNNL